MKLKSSIYRVASFALPISSASLINILSTFFAMLMVARLGKTSMAAGALAASTYITLMTVFATILYAVGILISHQRGQGKPASELGLVVKNGVLLALVLSIPASIFLWHADDVLWFFGQDPKLIAIAKPYFHFAAMAFFPSLFAGVISQFHTGIGEPRFSLLSALFRLPMIILFSYGFILGRLGLPKMGLAGVMCATFWVQSIYCVFLLFYCHRRQSLKAYQLFCGQLGLSWSICKKILLMGIPIGLQYGGELAAMTMATYMMGYYGVVALAASQMVSQYAMLLVMISLGLSQALSILSSDALGRGDHSSIKRYFDASIVLLAGVFYISMTVYLFLPKSLMSIYIDVNLPANAAIIHLASYFFIISGIVMFIDGLRNLLSGVLRGLQDSKTPMIIGTISLWLIAIPMSYWVSFGLHQGPVGLRLGFSSGFIVAAVLLYHRLHKALSAFKFTQIKNVNSNFPLSQRQ